jgi:hypothetical protein
VLLLPPAIAASQPTTLQPVFRFPLEKGYPSHCVQGEYGQTSHYHNESRFDLDFDTPNPTEPNDPLQVVAAADGIAYVYSNHAVYGNHVKISHGPGVFSLYGHLESVSIGNGQRVQAGDVIGIEGNTGVSEGDHVHFGVHVGNAQGVPVGTSVRLEYMAVIDTTENSDVRLLRGRTQAGRDNSHMHFICDCCREPNLGNQYEASEIPQHHTLDARQPVPEGFGAAFDVFSDQKELLLRATRTPEDTRITVGYNNEHTYIYHLGHQWINNQWEQIELQCIGEKRNIWCIGEAIGVISSQSAGFIAYTCRWKGNIIDGSWGCGCRDQQCAQPFWQLQTVE